MFSDHVTEKLRPDKNIFLRTVLCSFRVSTLDDVFRSNCSLLSDLDIITSGLVTTLRQLPARPLRSYQ